MRFHARVHQRLRVAWFVSFVVAEFAKADDIQHHVFIKFLPVVERDLQRAISRFRIVAIDVKDRQLRHARNVGGIDRRAAGFGRSGKSDLVVDDDVNRAAGAIAAQAGEIQRFHHDALTGKSRVAMQQHRQRQIDHFFARQAQRGLSNRPASRAPFLQPPDRPLRGDWGSAKASA